MARIDNLSNFLTDIADSIRSKKGTTDKLSPENFDTEIEGIETNSNPTLQTKSITITENGTQSVIPDEGYDGLEKVDIITNVSGGSESRLPTGYTEVEYIESTGAQYIDTGVLPDANTKLDIDFSYTNTTSNTQLFGSRKSWNQQGFYVGTKTNTVGSMFWIEFGSSFIETNLPTSDRNRHTISFSKKFYYDNVLKGSFSDTVTLDGYANIILFGSNEGEKNAVVPSAYKIYSCQIYENEEKIRDFVPCIQEETETIGLYDIINDFFYVNVGTGKFNKGKQATTSDVDIYDYFEYETTGNNYIPNFIKTIPLIKLSDTGDINNMFNNYLVLETIPLLDTSNVTQMKSVFSNCKSLKSIPQLNTSNVTDMASMFYFCEKLESIPLLDTSNVTNMTNIFCGCYSLKSIPQLDTGKVEKASAMFYFCEKLESIPELQFGTVTEIRNAFSYCNELTTLGGFINLGQAYLTTAIAINTQYILSLSDSKKLTHDSLMNVINGLYDIATAGCNTQQLTLGSTNIAKLTAEEIAIATNKGWSVVS